MIFQVARNVSTSLYEIHKAECAHLGKRHLEFNGVTIEAESGGAARAAYEASNDGILAKVANCAKGKR